MLKVSEMLSQRERQLYYTQEITAIEDKLVEVCRMTDSLLQQTGQALVTCDTYYARKLMRFESRIATRCNELQEETLALMLMQPNLDERDLRLLASIVSIIGELECVSDSARRLAGAVELLNESPNTVMSQTLERTVQYGRDILQHSLAALIRSNASLLPELALWQAHTTLVYQKAHHDLSALIAQNSSATPIACQVLWMMSVLKDINQHLINIASRINFVLTAQIEPVEALAS